MRVTSSIWVGAHIRRCFSQGAMATVVRRGAAEAGAIFVKINRLDGTFDLFGPVPQAFIEDAHPRDRVFESLFETALESDIDSRIDRERNFDSDLWLIEIEDREGRHFLETA